MTWSIYKDTCNRPVDGWEENYAAWYVDYDMETNHYPNRVKFLHDGYVHVWFDGLWTTCKVVNGRWAPETHDEILKMVAKAGYWGEFIEGFRLTEKRIHVIMGS